VVPAVADRIREGCERPDRRSNEAPADGSIGNRFPPPLSLELGMHRTLGSEGSILGSDS